MMGVCSSRSRKPHGDSKHNKLLNRSIAVPELTRAWTPGRDGRRGDGHAFERAAVSVRRKLTRASVPVRLTMRATEGPSLASMEVIANRVSTAGREIQNGFHVVTVAGSRSTWNSQHAGAAAPDRGSRARSFEIIRRFATTSARIREGRSVPRAAGGGPGRRR